MDRFDEIVSKAVVLDLSGVELFAQMGKDWMRREYNGIGPEFFPPELRAKVTAFLSIFEPAALIHDLRYSKSDGGRWAFNFANTEFLENCRVCADDRYSWWNWKRYRARVVARMLYDFVRGSKGWVAWTEAHRKRKVR